jgi:hypothetical protein
MFRKSGSKGLAARGGEKVQGGGGGKTARSEGWRILAFVVPFATVICFEAFADIRANMPSGLPVQVKPTFQEPYGPSFSFPQGGVVDTGGVAGATDTSSSTGGYSGTGSGVAGATVASNYSTMLGQSVGSGECVALVQATSDVGLTSTWTQGDVVQGNTNLAAGTVIATFGSDGTYTNTYGESHAAIYLGQDATGIQVEDQWANHAATQRTIPWTTSNSYESGSKFYVVSHA